MERVNTETQKLAAVGAAWWRKQLSEKSDAKKFDNGDGFTSSFAQLLSAGLNKQPLPDEQLQRFEQGLTSRLCNAIAESEHRTVLCVGVDYGPDDILADAATEAGILDADWPWKTTMWLRYGEEKLIEVSEGYGRPRVRVAV